MEKECNYDNCPAKEAIEGLKTADKSIHHRLNDISETMIKS